MYVKNETLLIVYCILYQNNWSESRRTWTRSVRTWWTLRKHWAVWKNAVVFVFCPGKSMYSLINFNIVCEHINQLMIPTWWTEATNSKKMKGLGKVRATEKWSTTSRNEWWWMASTWWHLDTLESMLFVSNLLKFFVCAVF